MGTVCTWIHGNDSILPPRVKASYALTLLSDSLQSIRIFLVFNLLVVVGLLIYDYFRPHEPGVRGRIRLVAFGSALSVLLFVSLTIIPEMLIK